MRRPFWSSKRSRTQPGSQRRPARPQKQTPCFNPPSRSLRAILALITSGYVMNAYADFLRKAGRGADARKARKRADAILQKFSKENLLGHTVDARAFR